ncbi:Putative altered inheritance of mitochondria protein 6, PI-PLC-like catalytic [Septoria linicola]|uniref:Altered inheritance of mitochondria protein 6, PI-PLC-like catalytic n=1 Tax=Septoria linicola TaxID=215465 RepID=A0A9Q9ASX9_9PEZI|nr:putative altered inheritance of mitochondria protein 6, PI-PLC-like catalytic [Septoria linicola]USW51432.1 Putative altered inheritance of mitochondria protein 6, PI-PLC-like catalytic [Septoria linicola]
MFSSTLALWATTASLTFAQSDIPLSEPLQKILAGAQKGDHYTYPTDLTQEIIPKAIHSHNDYWRPIPFYSALSVGAISVEADVWLINGTLHVGHEVSALTEFRTFDSLYIQPILDVLRKQNPNSSYVTELPTKNGVYDTSSGQTLYLFVDIKTDGEEAWPAVVEALSPLRDAGYLTTFNGTGTTSGPVTVVGTGNTPLDQVVKQSPRDIFYDAPLPTLNSTFSNITSDVSKIASTAFSGQFGMVRNGTLNATSQALLQRQIAVAHGKGIGVRYWDQPNWPVSNRDAIWRLLWAAGVDLINADDLEGAANL